MLDKKIFIYIIAKHKNENRMEVQKKIVGKHLKIVESSVTIRD